MSQRLRLPSASSVSFRVFCGILLKGKIADGGGGHFVLRNSLGVIPFFLRNILLR